MKLVVLGSVNADLYVHVQRIPAPGETISGTGGIVRPGGKGANQAVAAARLGWPTRFAGRIGSDAVAGPLRAELTTAGVDVRLLEAVDHPTGQAVIMLTPTGENSIIVVPGANAAWDTIDDTTAARIRSAGMLLLQREVPEPVNLAAAQVARAAGVPVVLDAGGTLGPLPSPLLECVDVLSPNRSELHALTGLPTDTTEEVRAAASSLLAKGVAEVLVKLGADGSALFGPDREPLLCPAHQVPVVDTTGAGDCFTAAFAVGRLSGQPQPAALRWASAAAAVCVQRLGAMPAMPTAVEVNALLAGSMR